MAGTLIAVLQRNSSKSGRPVTQRQILTVTRNNNILIACQALKGKCKSFLNRHFIGSLTGTGTRGAAAEQGNNRTSSSTLEFVINSMCNRNLEQRASLMYLLDVSITTRFLCRITRFWDFPWKWNSFASPLKYCDQIGFATTTKQRRTRKKIGPEQIGNLVLVLPNLRFNICSSYWCGSHATGLQNLLAIAREADEFFRIRFFSECKLKNLLSG